MYTNTRAHAGATLVDIACDAELVKLAKSIGDVPVCVSSVEPEEFLAAGVRACVRVYGARVLVICRARQVSRCWRSIYIYTYM